MGNPRPTHQEILAQTVRSLGGTWDTARAVTALRNAGYGEGDLRQQEKRARRALRDLAAANVITKVDPNSATYRTTIDKED
jgi:hypothetical protein